MCIHDNGFSDADGTGTEGCEVWCWDMGHYQRTQRHLHTRDKNTKETM